MEYRTLTGTGATVSRVCLGTMTFGQQVDELPTARMIDMALDAGVNFIDTADAYVGGYSEELLGRTLKRRRGSIVLASKVANDVGPDAHLDGGLHRRHVVQGVEASLRRLNTDFLDIYYLHKPDYNTPIEETLAAFDQLVQQGKVHYVGMSNFASWQVCEARWKCDVNRWAPPVVTQVPYSLITRGIEEEYVAFVKKMGIGVTVYNPLGAGMLTGKHRRDDGPAEGSRLATNDDYHGRFWHDANFTAVEGIEKIARDAGLTMVELALRWLASQDHVDSVILGASKPEHLEANLAAIDGRLDDATLEACDGVWQTLRGPHFRYSR
ncbi:aldo/keto reductase [Candidatus Poribacteria bacterium]|mgnify:CR=1 FL=1|jgi:1-deoxyxylulose-5-phosphate synthase|nr:aldo/keto reductase [Candidatus Poribacteria bacterium]MBT5536889.1 aldo/keto reductase [Candidatus Poribacteria bacterium]MBT7097775.1 aldo/keto reductase [Candidatus Poribacteria bacterium]MBT7809692.1 aldo/keto reductase [Candidatus Poribacteria bacterium]